VSLEFPAAGYFHLRGFNMSTDIYSLHNELAILRKLRDDLVSIAQTPQESASVAGQVTSLTKEIESLVKACLNYKLESGSLLERDSAERFGLGLLTIIKEEFAAIPDFEDMPKRAVDITCNPETKDLIDQLIGEYPDRTEITHRIVSRIADLVAELSNEPPPDTA
jgi:hypothetical protein